jgi:hypothetical protein
LFVYLQRNSLSRMRIVNNTGFTCMALDTVNLKTAVAETDRLLQGYKSMQCYQDFITYNTTKLSLGYRNGSLQKQFQIGISKHVIYVTSAACNSPGE